MVKESHDKTTMPKPPVLKNGEETLRLKKHA